MIDRAALVWIGVVAIGLSVTTASAQDRPPIPPRRTQDKSDTTAWPAAERSRMLDSLAAGRRRWRERRPRRYEFAAYTACGLCGGGSVGDPPGTHPIMRVDGEITSRGTYVPTKFRPQVQWLNITVDSLFEVLDAVARDTSRQVRLLRLDATYGFPRRWVVDDVHNGYAGYYRTDHDDWGEVDRFAPIGECGFLSWRRFFAATRVSCLR